MSPTFDSTLDLQSVPLTTSTPFGKDGQEKQPLVLIDETVSRKENILRLAEPENRVNLRDFLCGYVNSQPGAQKKLVFSANDFRQRELDLDADATMLGGHMNLREAFECRDEEVGPSTIKFAGAAGDIKGDILELKKTDDDIGSAEVAVGLSGSGDGGSVQQRLDHMASQIKFLMNENKEVKLEIKALEKKVASLEEKLDFVAEMSCDMLDALVVGSENAAVFKKIKEKHVGGIQKFFRRIRILPTTVEKLDEKVTKRRD